MSLVNLILCVLLISVTLVVPLTAIIVGKVKLKRALRPVEFYPPRGYSPVDVLFGYYGHNKTAHDIINPLMLYWADRGFITIEEDCKRGLKLTKLKDLTPPDFDLLHGTPRRVLANYEYEKELFDQIFLGSDVFYTLAAPSSFLDSNKEFIKKCNDKAKECRTPLSKKLYIMSTALAIGMLIIVTIICALTQGDFLYVAMVFPIVAVIFSRFAPFDGQWRYFQFIFFGAWGGIPFAAVLGFAQGFDTKFLLAAAFVVCVVVNIIARKIDIRTKKEIAVYGRIASFKTFLLEAEIARLELLVEENPHYYYDILPFCYALNITEKLKPKFDRIIMEGPSWYLGELRDKLMF
ncbi:MAG: DUF2207 domain-containing protein [Clostridiales bacterium]|nr:DUF2207 domain-containing protein [Clostridiales bacterium]